MYHWDMIKLLPLILENEVDHEVDLGKSHLISEQGYSFLKSTLEVMNKKAVKWGVPPMSLKVLNEVFAKKKIWINSASGQKTNSDDPEKQEKEITVKQYEVQIIGEPPVVEGYEFIAKVEHTPDGNILNYAPRASDKSIPHEYRTATQQCDVCRTTRDRNNTFILKLENDDQKRFPEKKKGDFVMVGSGCLKRFLPGTSASSLMEYAEMIESIRSSIQEASEMEDDSGNMSGGYNGRGDYMSQEELGLWLSAVYLHTGKFISKKKATEFQTSSTIDNVFSAMNSRTGMERGRDIEDPVHRRMREDEVFINKANSLNAEFLEWAKTKDFDALMTQNPNFSDFYHNLKVLSKQNTFKTKNSGFFSALFATFLRDKGEMEKKSAQKKASADFTYFGKPGEKIKVKIKVNKIKEYESQYGQGLIINMEGNGQEVDSATGQPLSKRGNLLYFTSKFELEEGEEAEIEATVKSHQPNKYTQIPETVITRAKVVNFITHPEKNAGKSKVKDLSGTVKILSVREQPNWKTQQNEYSATFSYDLDAHPDMRQLGSNWGVSFIAHIPDEQSYRHLKQYENKLVNAKWSLSRGMSVDKLKEGNYHPAIKLQVTQVLGDISPNP